jgi:hypothetical protein
MRLVLLEAVTSDFGVSEGRQIQQFFISLRLHAVHCDLALRLERVFGHWKQKYYQQRLGAKLHTNIEDNFVLAKHSRGAEPGFNFAEMIDGD